ncbi:TIGR03862 family flavoprotein [Acinetobacter larvae]|uniref:Flavoprotein n=1 Tax=Acinetobacter larvae TaxID=1789224 RepID=A0A1B2LWA3_9GAMM|nr:TIGR03862 family flavoprotein [Acinetobacter larvae]AOA57221.1 flavoprotein [Acinetobacter larvae]
MLPKAQARIAIVGAGPAGLMAAEQLAATGQYQVVVYEQKPSAARKFLMAGKTGLNISHAEAQESFIQRYDQAEWLAPWLRRWDAAWIQRWMHSLGVEAYTGSSGRIFPKEMKAAPLLRAWLARLTQQGVTFHYRHQVLKLTGNSLTLLNHQQPHSQQQCLSFDAIILACGAVSWPQLGSDGAWQSWLPAAQRQPFVASNAGVDYAWSPHMQPIFGQPLKRVAAWVAGTEASMGDIVISHYGLESGLIYKYNRALRLQLQQTQQMQLYLDLLPDLSRAQLIEKLRAKPKQSLSNLWRKAGLDRVKAALVRECVDKTIWHDAVALAAQIKALPIALTGFRPIAEAISCAGGVKRDALTDNLGLKHDPAVFCCGEMLDWDAPTGGYLLTACFATGHAAAQGVITYLNTLAADHAVHCEE